MIAPPDSRQVQKLRRHELVWRAWGDDLVRPKHHHRFHIPAACEQLQFLPHCAIQEKKHQRDNGLLCADSVFMWKRKIAVGDVVLLTDNVAGQFIKAVCGPACGLYLRLQTMEKITDHPWGSRWKTSDLKKWWKPQPEIDVTLAAWWCFVGSDVCYS